MVSRRWRAVIMTAVLIITVLVFWQFISRHPDVRHQLVRTAPSLLISISAGYLLFSVSLGLILDASLRLCKTRLPFRETMLVTAYSSVINFFGPLQSGPAFRALYLKRRHRVSIKQYSVATMVYYVFFAFFSGLFLLSSWLGWWLLLSLPLAFLTCSLVRHLPLPIMHRVAEFDWRGIGYMAMATLLQVSLMAGIFYLELHNLTKSLHLNQVMTYTGAANFALFVSITPGAIGFRESFLAFSERLHHIGNSTIVAANLIDRCCYILVLLLLAALIFGTHAAKGLQRIKETE